jgi:hypothetical protein
VPKLRQRLHHLQLFDRALATRARRVTL